MPDFAPYVTVLLVSKVCVFDNLICNGWNDSRNLRLMVTSYCEMITLLASKRWSQHILKVCYWLLGSLTMIPFFSKNIFCYLFFHKLVSSIWVIFQKGMFNKLFYFREIRSKDVKQKTRTRKLIVNLFSKVQSLQNVGAELRWEPCTKLPTFHWSKSPLHISSTYLFFSILVCFKNLKIRCNKKSHVGSSYGFLTLNTFLKKKTLLNNNYTHGLSSKKRHDHKISVK